MTDCTAALFGIERNSFKTLTEQLKNVEVTED